MKFEEVLPALRAGKKITNSIVKDNGYKYIYYKEGAIFDNEGGLYYHLSNRQIVNYDDWEVVEEKRKVKLRDLTKEQYREYEKGCSDRICTECLFRAVECELNRTSCWFHHKDLYSDKFLDQEIEIEEE